jgi:D-proline reductase (dithiol) PrdB
MGDLNEFSFLTRWFLKTYRWQRIDPVPFTPLNKPLSECRLALVSSSAMILPGQEPFKKRFGGSDSSFREIPSDIDATELLDTHSSRYFDHFGLLLDPNVMFPIDRVLELAVGGRIGSVNRRHFSFQGAILNTRRLVKETAPLVASALKKDGVDVVVLCPAGPLCNQSVGLVAAELERRGISTVTIQLLRFVAESVRPPRALYVPCPHGYPFDAPFEMDRQHAVLEAALRMLENPTLKSPALVDYQPNQDNYLIREYPIHLKDIKVLFGG